MRSIKLSALMFLLSALLGTAAASHAANPQKKEYLSDAEADKIRDAGASGPRIKLFAAFAGDRIKKLQYEFAHLDSTDEKRTDRINALINGYSGCVDDAADLVELGINQQEDIREGVKALRARLKESLPYLQDLAAKGPERETYKDNLDDAIESTQDASKDVDRATKEMAPPPVRRKPS